MTGIKSGAWVVVADSEKALFLENMTDAQDPNLVVRRVDEQDNPSDGAQSANRPGRMDGAGGRSAFDDTDWHQLQKERFAEDLAETLYKMAHKHRFESLIIVASPQVLGDLRPHLHKEVKDRLVGEIAKTLTNHPLSEVEKIVSHAAA
ncbi:Protein required for attachment to host cells [Aquimixticola soesokkakensis]|uniref:Protein required for attachment to host cells n=1 Tax=Aquimixticola soesokkakensis TaxID=1519096 RepID=A0A1Y5SKB7_9RHOB|nr:host attachment family protein [Aquimixticola soesokkakensis]SLN42165.1 Protein required for attachment to host cells [Aquimixticola soesokkakensis]